MLGCRPAEMIKTLVYSAGEGDVVLWASGSSARQTELTRDRDVPVARAKELFVLSLYDRAETRFRTSTRISLAFDTALRTVKKIKKRYKENAVEDVAGQDYNLRKKVYLMIMDKEMELDEIARELPINYEVNYARLAIEVRVADVRSCGDEVCGGSQG